MSTRHGLKLAKSKNYFDLTKIFVLRKFKTATNQTEHSRFEQRSLIKFLVAEKCKPCEIYRRTCDVYREAYFSKNKKGFTNWLNINLPLQDWVKKTIHGVETYRFSGKKKVLDTAISKERETIQTTAILRSARIQRRVLETRRDMLALRLQWKTIR